MTLYQAPYLDLPQEIQDLLGTAHSKRRDHHVTTPVYVDSPMAVEATGVFQENRWECFDDEAMEFVKEGINPIAFSGLKLSITSEESKAINFDETPRSKVSCSTLVSSAT